MVGLPSPGTAVFDPARDVYWISVVDGGPGLRPGAVLIAWITGDVSRDGRRGRIGIVSVAAERFEPGDSPARQPTR